MKSRQWLFFENGSALTDEKSVKWLADVDAYVDRRCLGEAVAIPAFPYGEAPGGIFFTSRGARTQFVSALPAYGFGEADPGANLLLADRGILGVQGVAYFA